VTYQFLQAPKPVDLAQGILSLFQTRVCVRGREHLPSGPLLAIANHRSFMDALVVMAALQRTVHFACHYYMTQVPGLREFVTQLGCIPLERQGRSQAQFFQAAETMLQQQQAVGLFPEGAQAMACRSTPNRLAPFQRGFAYLALRSQVNPLPLVPLAIRVRDEFMPPDLPLFLFRWFDPNEPMFQGNGGHPVVIYRQIDVEIAPPIWVTTSLRQDARRGRAKACVDTLTHQTQSALHALLSFPDNDSPTHV
jgi:1-acyl-sn-glycerol-3-phosphate acyltransferase